MSAEMIIFLPFLALVTVMILAFAIVIFADNR